MTIQSKIINYYEVENDSLPDTIINYTFHKNGFKLSKVDDSRFKIEKGSAIFYEPNDTYFSCFRKTKVYLEEDLTLDIPTELQEHSTCYVYLKSNGTIYYSFLAPDLNTFDSYMSIGVLTSVDGGKTFFRVTPWIIDSSPNNKMSITMGILNASNMYLEPVEGTLKFSNKAGIIWATGRNFWIDKSSPDICKVEENSEVTITYVLSDGSIIGVGNEFRPKLYEQNGTEAELNNNRFGISFVYISSNGDVAIVPGQASYNNFTSAERNIGTLIHQKPYNLSGFTLITKIIHAANATDETKLKLYPINKFGALGEFNDLPIDNGLLEA